MPQLVQTKGLSEDVGSLPIRRNVLKFDFNGKDTLTNEMIVHLNVLGPMAGSLDPTFLSGP